MFQQLRDLGGDEFAELVKGLIWDNADPVQASHSLQRWLANTANPKAYTAQLLHQKSRLELLLLVLGASQPFADSLIQNPEFGSLVLNPFESEAQLSAAAIVEEGFRLLKSSTGPLHSLDRLRYLKQKSNLSICLNDVSGHWPQEQIWRALSDLADAILELTLVTTWTRFAEERNLPPAPPVGIVGFGKLGGRELNYSSDIDLAYVLDDEADERLERECTRFCEAFGRALSDRMGRGALFRVDLRLRPFGSQGPILSRFRAFDNYYKLYAEAWEIQALIKSRVICGEKLRVSWSEMKHRSVFESSMSDASLSELLKTRDRIEEQSGEDDLKRGPGGIRDVEFLCQTLQLIHGRVHPEVRSPATCPALRALSQLGLLDAGHAAVLLEGYTFLRKLEHRIQFLGDRQTHTLPSSGLSRRKLASLMGLDFFESLAKVMVVHRKSIRLLYRSILKREEEPVGARSLLARRFGSEAGAFLQWFDSLPEPEAYYRAVEDSQDAACQIETILRLAPRLARNFKENLSLTDSLLSGELEEVRDEWALWRDFSLTADERWIAALHSNNISAAQAAWTLTNEGDLSKVSRDSIDGLFDYCSRRLGIEFDIVALGSYGCGQQAAPSDIDVLFLCKSSQREAEVQAQALINLLLRLKRYGFESKVDLRLRPDGRRGLLVRSYDGFGAYEAGDMETWERFALGNARLVHGSPESVELVRRAAYARPLTGNALLDLVEMKRRIENERLKPQHASRDVKLGHGGLNDLEWIVHLLEMFDSERSLADPEPLLALRIRNLARRGVINTFEAESLLEAREHLLAMRNRIWLLDYSQDFVPENPARLERLAEAMRFKEGNDLLRAHEPIVGWVRSFFNDTLRRLGVAKP